MSNPVSPAERPPRILLRVESSLVATDLERALVESNYQTVRLDLKHEADFAPALDDFDLILALAPSGCEPEMRDWCRRIKLMLAERFVPIVFLTSDDRPSARALSSEVGVDAHLVLPIDTTEFLAQVRSLLRIKSLQDRVVEQSAELERVYRRLQLTYEQIDQELLLARRLQESFLPRALPAVGAVSFAVRFAISGRVGGDFYDCLRLDERTLGFYVADAMGHGIPASLLTIYVKKGIMPKEIFENGYRILPPNEVLRRLNQDLIEQDLSENPFITMAYFTIDIETRRLAFARAGHPHPLRLRAGRPIEPMQTQGTLLGVIETDYPLVEMACEPGDRLLVHTDGIDGVTFRDHQPGMAAFLACLEENRALPLNEMLDRVYGELFPTSVHEDDLTLFAVEIG